LRLVLDRAAREEADRKEEPPLETGCGLAAKTSREVNADFRPHSRLKRVIVIPAVGIFISSDLSAANRNKAREAAPLPCHPADEFSVSRA